MKIIHVLPGEDLQSIFDSAPENATIYLPEGKFNQKTVIRTSGIKLIGAGADKTIISFDDYARKRDFLGARYNTFRTYTMAVCADDVMIKDLSIVNEAKRPEMRGQEVALSVLGSGFYMENCILSSTQDTLFVGPLPSDLIGRYEGFLTDELRKGTPMTQNFVECRIEGTIDFIFGCGEALFERCEIRSLKDVRETCYVAAPAHELGQKTGFLFVNCSFTCDSGVAFGSVYLARPWRDHGMAEFRNCIYGWHIAPVGFDKWNGTDRDKTARFFETPAIAQRASWINRNKESL